MASELPCGDPPIGNGHHDLRPTTAPPPDDLSRVMEKLDEVRDAVLNRTDELHQAQKQLDAIRLERDAARARCACLEERLDTRAGQVAEACADRDHWKRLAGAHFAEIQRAQGIIDDAKLRISKHEACVAGLERELDEAKQQPWKALRDAGYTVEQQAVRSLKLDPHVVAGIVVSIDHKVTELRERLIEAEAEDRTIEIAYLRRARERWLDLLAILDEHCTSIEVVARVS